MGKNSGKRQKNHQGKKATKRRGWTTDDQFKYLNDLLPSFKTAQVSNTTHEMWAPIENQWFTQWPLPVLTEAESVNDFARRKKIMDRVKAWFGNHARDHTTNAETSSKDVLDLRDRKPKKLSAIQAYQRLYYKEKIKDVVDKRWAERLELEKANPPVPPLLPLPKNPPLKFRNVITKEFYEAEKEDIKVKVEEYRQNPQAAIDESDDDNENDDDEEIDEVEIRRVDSAKKINRAQKAAVNTMGLALAQVEREANMIGVVVLACADPELGGTIKVASIAQGTNTMGHAFTDLYGPDWEKYVEEPLGDFFNEIFPAPERATLALPGTESLAIAHQPGEYQWRYLQGGTAQSRIGFARGASNAPSNAGTAVRSLTPARPQSTTAPSTILRDRIKCTPRVQPATPSIIGPVAEDSTETPGCHGYKEMGEVPVVVDVGEGDNRGAENVEEGEVPSIVESADVEMTSLEDHDNECESASPTSPVIEEQIMTQDTEGDASPVIEKQTAMKDTEGDAISDDPSWDNGEPLAEDERTHLLTLDLFSRVQEMKRRRRKRLEMEALGASDLNDTQPSSAENPSHIDNVQTTSTSAENSESRTIENPSQTDDVQTTSTNTETSKSHTTVSDAVPPNTTDSDAVPPKLPSPSISLSPSKSASIASSHSHKDVWPSWIREALPELEKMVDSSAWKLLIWEWLDLEHVLGYPSSGKAKRVVLDNNHRPPEVGDWFQYGRRSWDKQPLIAAADLDRYSTDWWKWWAHLQPSSRASEDPLHMPRELPEDGDWSSLMKGSNNGFFMILVALGWWAQGAQFAGRDIKAWVYASADVMWVLDQVRMVAETRKRARDDDDVMTESTTASSRPVSKRAKTTPN